MWDALIPDDKWQVLDRAQSNVDQINAYFEEGFLNETERHDRGRQRVDRRYRRGRFQDARDVR